MELRTPISWPASTLLYLCGIIVLTNIVWFVFFNQTILFQVDRRKGHWPCDQPSKPQHKVREGQLSD